MLNRLLGIMYVLLNKENVTAKELAERFEVSERTIYRDVERLSQVGIPLYTQIGKNGGIHLMKQFVLNKMLITEEEQQQILSALVSLDETTSKDKNQTLQKLGEFFNTKPINWISIEYSNWGEGQRQLYEDIKRSILSRKVISFDYYGQNREMSRRTVEPIQLIFKEYTWYLHAFCRERQDFRLFKLTRMKRIEVSDEIFVLREGEQHRLQQGETRVEYQKVDALKMPSYAPTITMWIDKKEAWRVYDRFDESEIEILQDGNFMVRISYPLDEWVYGLILSFGASAKVLEPPEIKMEIQKRIADMAKNYEF